MIIILNTYTSQEVIILVNEIRYVECKESTHDGANTLDKRQYEFTIKFKDHSELRFWYNGKKEQFQSEYDKVKSALTTLYKKDTIQEEIKKYLENLNK